MDWHTRGMSHCTVDFLNRPEKVTVCPGFGKYNGYIKFVVLFKQKEPPTLVPDCNHKI